jgi:hypothetical protein
MKQRASMLKRLSFAVFSSEQDQYQSFLPEFQERLAECLRMPQVPVLHEQVFLFFRVLLVRMSDNMTSIWPMIISEMIHVFLLMESDLLQADTPSRDQQMFYSETVLGASGYVNYSQEKWLGLYLSVCKLLDMAFCLPPEQLPQFQMYRWAFESPGNRNKPTRNVPSSETQRDLKTSETVGDLETTESAKKGTKKSGKSQDTNKSEKKLGSSKAAKNHGTKDSDGNVGSIFRPYVSRITKLLAKRKNIYVSEETIDCHRGRPLLTMYQLESVDELLPFLRMLSEDGRILLDMRSSEKSKTRRFKSGNGARNFLEKLIERDFLEPLGE